MRGSRLLISLIAVLVVLAMPLMALASGTKEVVIYREVAYICYDAYNCDTHHPLYEYYKYEAVSQNAQLVSTRQEISESGTYPFVRTVRTWYFWAECVGGVCPSPDSLDPERR